MMSPLGATPDLHFHIIIISKDCDGGQCEGRSMTSPLESLSLSVLAWSRLGEAPPGSGEEDALPAFSWAL